MAIVAFSQNCGLCPSVGKEVVSTVSQNGYIGFALHGVYLLYNDETDGIWEGRSSFTVNEFVKRMRTRDDQLVFRGFNPFLVTTDAILYRCISNVTDSGDPATNPAHWVQVPIVTRGQAVSSFLSVPSPIAPLVRYEVWTDTTVWEFNEGILSPPSGEVIHSWRRMPYNANVATNEQNDVEPYTPPIPVAYPFVPKDMIGSNIFPEFGDNVSVRQPNRALHDFSVSENAQTFEWRYYQVGEHFAGSLYHLNLVGSVTQTVELSTPHTQGESAEIAQALIDSVDLNSVNYGQTVRLSINTSGAVISTVAAHGVGACGTNQLIGMAATRGKGRAKLMGQYCRKFIPRGNPGATICEQGDAGCETEITVNPPGFDGSECIEPGCTCAP